MWHHFIKVSSADAKFCQHVSWFNDKISGRNLFKIKNLCFIGLRVLDMITDHCNRRWHFFFWNPDMSHIHFYVLSFTEKKNLRKKEKQNKDFTFLNVINQWWSITKFLKPELSLDNRFETWLSRISELAVHAPRCIVWLIDTVKMCSRRIGFWRMKELTSEGICISYQNCA